MNVPAVLTLMRVGAFLREDANFTAQDVADAVTTVRADLAAGRDSLDGYLTARAKGAPWEEVIAAADSEQLTWKDGRPMFGGDFMNAYAYPALVYGIALGLCLAEDMNGGAR